MTRKFPEFCLVEIIVVANLVVSLSHKGTLLGTITRNTRMYNMLCRERHWSCTRKGNNLARQLLMVRKFPEFCLIEIVVVTNLVVSLAHEGTLLGTITRNTRMYNMLCRERHWSCTRKGNKLVLQLLVMRKFP